MKANPGSGRIWNDGSPKVGAGGHVRPNTSNMPKAGPGRQRSRLIRLVSVAVTASSELHVVSAADIKPVRLLRQAGDTDECQQRWRTHRRRVISGTT